MALGHHRRGKKSTKACTVAKQLANPPQRAIQNDLGSGGGGRVKTLEHTGRGATIEQTT